MGQEGSYRIGDEWTQDGQAGLEVNRTSIRAGVTGCARRLVPGRPVCSPSCSARPRTAFSRAGRPSPGGRNDRIGQPGNGVPADIRTDIAHPARVYDYWLGGKDNFAADRAAAEQVVSVMPEILDTARGNRQFLVRTVRFLRDAGIRQFIDIGSGLPSSPNVHEIAQAAQGFRQQHSVSQGVPYRKAALAESLRETLIALADDRPPRSLAAEDALTARAVAHVACHWPL